MTIKDTYHITLFNPDPNHPEFPVFLYPGVKGFRAMDLRLEFVTETDRKVVSNLKYLIVQEAEKNEEAKA